MGSNKGEALLQLDRVTVQYGRFVALRDVSYNIFPGQMVSLLGGNASGKSTSIKSVFGVAKVTSGDVYFNGEKITGWTTERRVRAGLAIVPEGRRLFRRMSVEENILIGAVNRKDAHAVKSDLDNLYDMFPRLVERRHQLAGTLSGGEQQMGALARAMMSKPKLVLMDEPSMGLAPSMVKKSFALIEQVRDAGTSVFVVEQNANAALRIADYAYVLRAGELVLEGTAAEIAESSEMKEAYLGKGDS